MEAGDAAEWLLHAESDLTYAKLGQAEPAILRNQVTFHAEQAAEKAFKAVLVHAAVEFPTLEGFNFSKIQNATMMPDRVPLFGLELADKQKSFRLRNTGAIFSPAFH